MSEFKGNQELTSIMTLQDKITEQLKLIDMQMKQIDQKLFRSEMEDDIIFQVHHLTRKSVLEGIVKMLMKVKEENNKKIEEIYLSDSETEDSFEQSLDTSQLDNSLNQSEWNSTLNLKMDKFAGPMTKLFTSSCRGV